MKTFFAKLRDLFCYCGLPKEEYRTVKEDAYRSNFTVWKYLFAFFFFAYAFMTATSFIYGAPDESSFLQVGMTLYFAVMEFLFTFVYKSDRITPQFAIYFSMILLLSSSMVLNIFEPDGIMSVLFMILLVMLPMFMIDKPYFMAILLSLSVLVYLVSIRPIKSPEMFHYEVIFSITYGAFGIAINTFYNFIRVQEFILRKKELKHAEEQKAANEETEKLNAALKKMSESALELLGNIVEGRDTESGEHINRVKGFAYILANQVMQDLPEYHLDSYTVDLIAYTSALHDVGKISISDAILCKPGKLTSEEYEVMKTHCEKGCAIIGKMANKWSRDYLEMGMSICMNHHEKWDGKGYPRGLSGDDIPIEAQIVSIADIFDALITKRVYKEAYSFDTAFEMILAGDCGAFSGKLLKCFLKCYNAFAAHASGNDHLVIGEHDYELVSRSNPDESFVVGLHDNDRTLREKLRLDEEVSVLESLSENYCYVCYVNMQTNTVSRYRADKEFERILNSYGTELPSNKRFDKLLNSIIVSEDYEGFRRATDREKAVEYIQSRGHMTTDFRIRLEDGIHYCRMRISLVKTRPDAVIIGISMRDEEHRVELEYVRLQNELEQTRKEVENREKLADRLAVIDSIGDEYDYICTLNAETMDVIVYRAEEWFRDMFKNLEDMIVSPQIRNEALQGIIHPDDFADFQALSRHSEVMRNLSASGVYTVNYRAFKYGTPMNYQTRYSLDKSDPKRIVIGIRCLGPAESQ